MPPRRAARSRSPSSGGRRGNAGQSQSRSRSPVRGKSPPARAAAAKSKSPLQEDKVGTEPDHDSGQSAVLEAMQLMKLRTSAAYHFSYKKTPMAMLKPPGKAADADSIEEGEGELAEDGAVREGRAQCPRANSPLDHMKRMEEEKAFLRRMARVRSPSSSSPLPSESSPERKSERASEP
eukprot:2458940-Rhodomonas_salina.2